MPYTTFQMPSVAAQQQATPARTRRQGLKLDLRNGDIATDGAGRLVLANPDVTAAEWGVIQLLTERYSALVFSRQIGTQIDTALAKRQHAAVEQALQHTAIEACTFPSSKITQVRDFVFRWSGNTVEMSLTFVLNSGRTHRTTIAFTA